MALLTYLFLGTMTLVLVSRYLQHVELRVGCVLLLLPLLFTGSALIRGAAYAPADIPLGSEPLASHARAPGLSKVRSPALSDVATLMIPWRASVKAAYARGEWPLWNPSVLCGDILAAASEPSPYHPVRLSGLHLSPASAITFEASMTLLLAGLSMLLLLRKRSHSFLASLFGAAIWMFSDFLTFYLEYPMANALSILPFLIFAVELLLSGESKKGFFSLTLGFVFLILAGHPESTLHAVAVVAVYFMLRLVASRSSGVWRPASVATLAGVGAVGLCALFLFPFFEALPQTLEFSFRIEHEAIAKRSVSIGDAMERMSVTFFPSRFGDDLREVPSAAAVPGILWSGFSGVLAFALALAGAVAMRRRSFPWVLVFLFGLLAGVRFPGVMETLDLIPLFDIALNDRLIFLVPFSLGILGAAGIDFIVSTGSSRVVPAVLVLYIALLTVVAPIQYTAGLTMDFILQEIVGVMMLTVAGVSGLLILKRADSRVVLLLALLLFERANRRAGFHPLIEEKDFYPTTEMLRTIQRDPEQPRIIASEFNFVPNIASMYGLADARGFEGMTFARLYETFPLWSVHQPVWFNRVDDLDSSFLSMMNVRYAIVEPHFSKRSDWELLLTDGDAQLLRNRRALPRAFAPGVITFSGRAETVTRMRDVTDFAAHSMIESEGESGTRKNGPATIGIIRRGSGYRLKVESASESWIVVSESAWKGWRATVDGIELPIRYGNHAFVAFKAPRGSSEIDLRYAPQSFYAGLAVSSMTLAFYAAAALYLGRRRRV